MEQSSIVSTVHKIALLAQEAGLSVDTMIQLLDAGVRMETLLRIIALPATDSNTPPVAMGDVSFARTANATVELSSQTSF